MKQITVMLAAMCSFSAFAAAVNYTYVGDASGTGGWADPANWRNGTSGNTGDGYPGSGGASTSYGDVATFDPGDGGEVSLAYNVSIGRNIVVKSGRVTLTPGNSAYIFRNASITVEDGASLVVSGRCQPYNTNTSNWSIEKRGGGTLTVNGIGGSATRYYGSATVSAGTLTVVDKAYVSGTVTVADGATLVMEDGFGIISTAVIPTAKISLAGPNARVRFASSCNAAFAGVEGGGVIEGASGSRCRFNLSAGAMSFSGTTEGEPSIQFTNTASVAAADFAYTLQTAEAFANATVSDASGALRFASGVGRFRIGRLVGDMAGNANATAIVACDVSGEPVEIATWTDPSAYLPGVRLAGGDWSGAISNAANSGQLWVSGTNRFVEGALKLSVPLNVESDGVFRLAGGTVDCGAALPAIGDGTLEISSGSLAYATESNKFNVATPRRLPTGLRLDGSTALGTLRISGADAYVDSRGTMPKRVEVSDGTLVKVGSGWSSAAATAEDPSELVLDGGRLHLSGRNGATTGNARSHHVFTAGADARLLVGERGAEIASVENAFNGRGSDSVGYWAANSAPPRIVHNHAIEKADGIAAAGEVVFRGWARHEYNKPVSTGGTLRFADGFHYAADADALAAAEGKIFGDGDITLRAAGIGILPGLSTGSALKLATGEGRTLTYSGSAVIVGCDSDGDTPRSIEIGSLSRAGKGSVLYVKNTEYSSATTFSPTIGETGHASVKVAGGVPTDSHGVAAIPVAQYSIANRHWPLKYDSERGFVSMTSSDWTTGLTAGEYCTISADRTLSSSIRIAGLYAGNYKISIAEGAVLGIGDGVNPAYVCWNHNTTLFEGSGSVDFGGSEGVFLCSASYDSAGRLVGCTLSGSNGVTFAGPFNLSCLDAGVKLSARNTYTGGTYISSAIVHAAHPECFASGDVVVFGGEMAGGTVRFECDGTWMNDFKIAGHGIRREKYNKTPFGALIFCADATIDGDVEITEPARVSVSGTGAGGTILGTVSGDRLSVYSFDGWDGGVLELAGSNTYTGGTEVVNQAIAVRTSFGFGTGSVDVDGGRLIFRNESSVSIPNTISGTGELFIEGEGAVNFTGDVSGFSATGMVFSAGVHAVESDFRFRPLVAPSVRAQRAHLVLKAPGAYTLSQSDLEGVFELTLEDGATLDLGGETLTVFRFNGSRSSVNGAVRQTNAVGLNIIVR